MDQLGAMLGYVGQCWLMLALLADILSPSCSKMAPRWPNIAQHSAKMSQHGVQEHPQDPRKPCKSDELSSFFGFSLVLARSPPRSKKRRPDPPKSARKMPILGSMCAILATSWREVGQLSAILAPTWPILAPRCAPAGLRREPRARPNQHLGASWRQAARQEPPNLPGTSIFSRFCFHFGTDFIKSC